MDSLTLGQICESDGRSVIKKEHECGSGLLSEEAANMCGAMTQRGASLDLGVKTHDTWRSWRRCRFCVKSEKSNTDTRVTINTVGDACGLKSPESGRLDLDALIHRRTLHLNYFYD